MDQIYFTWHEEKKGNLRHVICFMKKKVNFGVLGLSPYVSNGVPQSYLDPQIPYKLKDIQHINLFPRLGDVHVTFKNFSHCFVQQPLYLLHCTLFFPTFINSLLFLVTLFFLKCLNSFWIQSSLIIHNNF